MASQRFLSLCNPMMGRVPGANSPNVVQFQLGCTTKASPQLQVRAKGGNSSSSSHVSVERINGKKVNGISINAPEIENNNVGSNNNANVEHNGYERLDVPMHAFKLGRFLEGRLVYRQTFVIRSYEIGPDRTATMETLMNLLQETALNHVTSSGLAGDGFGATHQMSLRKLIWVVTRVNLHVHKYSHWGDVIEIDTWVDASGKNGLRRDWVIRDYQSQEIITRATSNWVIMNRETRRLCKIPEEVRDEVKPFYLNRRVMNQTVEDIKIDKLDDDTTDHIRSGLAPRWSDMDVNQHVNNVKYIGWILESVPLNVLEDYRMTSLTLEYRRECRQSNLLESLTSTKTQEGTNHVLGSTHLLRLQDNKSEIVRARAEWSCKRA